MNKKQIGLVVVVIAIAGVGGYFIRGNSTQSTNSSSASTSPTAKTPAGKGADYSSKALSAFPKEVLKNTSITSLNLSNNNLTGSLPSEIHNLANLELLDVSNNQMTGIPAEVGQLKHLKVLNYANNKITGLPNELGNLTQLEILDLSGNNVSQQDLNGIRAKLTQTEIRL